MLSLETNDNHHNAHLYYIIKNMHYVYLCTLLKMKIKPFISVTYFVKYMDIIIHE